MWINHYLVCMQKTAEHGIPQQVKATVDRILPTARVILYGSRARGDDHKNSDWDFLILTEQEATPALQDRIREALYGIELESEEIITSIIEQKDQWEKYLHADFYQNVAQDGIEIERAIAA